MKWKAMKGRIRRVLATAESDNFGALDRGPFQPR